MRQSLYLSDLLRGGVNTFWWGEKKHVALFRAHFSVFHFPHKQFNLLTASAVYHACSYAEGQGRALRYIQAYKNLSASVEWSQASSSPLSLKADDVWVKCLVGFSLSLKWAEEV